MPALAVYAICLAVYALTCGSAIGWLDAPELLAAGSSLGVAHSPGHPLVVMIAKIAALLPIGDLPFRVALASALCAAGAATAVFCLVRRLVSRLRGSAFWRDALAVGFALAFAFSWAAWIQAVRAEVYALEALLVVIALAAALAYRVEKAPRSLLLFALTSSLAAINHPAIAATVLIPATILILAQRPRPRHLAAAATLAIAGAASILYLPIRAAAGPALNWGDPQTLGRLWWTLTGRAFHKTAAAEQTSTLGQDAAQIVVALADAATIPLVLLAVAAVYLAFRLARDRALVATLLAIALGAALGRAALGFDPETPDHHAYLIGGIVSIGLLAVLAVVTIADAIERRGPPRALTLPSAAVALIGLASVQYFSNYERSTLREERASDQLAEVMIAELPPRTLLLTAYFETRFQLYAAAEVFGERPDVVVLDRSFLTYPGAVAHQVRLHPQLALLIERLDANQPPPLAALSRATESRPVFVELHPNVGPDLRAHLAPLGAFSIYLASAPGALRHRVETLDRAASARLALTAATDVLFDGERAMISSIWRDYLKLELYCELGRAEAAAATYQRVQPRVHGDRSFEELAAGCGLGGAP